MCEMTDEAGRRFIAMEFLVALALCVVRFGGLPMPGGRSLIGLLGGVLMTIVFFSLLWQHFRAPQNQRRALGRTQVILGLFWPGFLSVPLLTGYLTGIIGCVAGIGLLVCMVALLVVTFCNDDVFRARMRGFFR